MLSTGQRASSRICALALARIAPSSPRLPVVGMTMTSARKSSASLRIAGATALNVAGGMSGFAASLAP